jgi:hypothetical protein
VNASLIDCNKKFLAQFIPQEFYKIVQICKKKLFLEIITIAFCNFGFTNSSSSCIYLHCRQTVVTWFKKFRNTCHWFFDWLLQVVFCTNHSKRILQDSTDLQEGFVYDDWNNALSIRIYKFKLLSHLSTLHTYCNH